MLPLHHPIRVAEQWATLDLLSNGRVDFAAGRGYDRREYLPFHVSFDDNQSIFDEGLELVRALWASDERMTYKGKHYQFEDVRITPKPVQNPIPTYVASFSKPSIELAARLGCGLIVAPFAAAMSFGGLKQVADLYHESCAKYGTKPGRLMCSYFTHFADNKPQEDAQRARQIRYYKECVIPAFPGDPKTAPPSYRYFIDMVERLHKVKPEDLTENSVLIGSAARITETLKKVEAAGFEEVILYFNVGLKPHGRSRTRWPASWNRSPPSSRASTGRPLKRRQLRARRVRQFCSRALSFRLSRSRRYAKRATRNPRPTRAQSSGGHPWNARKSAFGAATRRDLLKGAAAASLAGAFPMPAIAQAKPVKVGLMLPYSGTFAQLGENITHRDRDVHRREGRQARRPRDPDRQARR